MLETSTSDWAELAVRTKEPIKMGEESETEQAAPYSEIVYKLQLD